MMGLSSGVRAMLKPPIFLVYLLRAGAMSHQPQLQLRRATREVLTQNARYFLFLPRLFILL
jgi:hypothetical protein